MGTEGVLVHNSCSVSNPCIQLAPTPSAVFAVIRNKWLHTMSPNEMREIAKAVDHIRRNDASRYPTRDGSVYQNSPNASPDAINSQRLNTSETYKEWTVKTPGLGNRGTRRIVVSDQTGRAYYTHDHYDSFIEIDLLNW